MSVRTRITPVIAVLALVTTAALGQEVPEGGVVFELNYSNPGARSLALGGAFAALADDATAAFANPAGLVQLVDLEVSVEGRYRSFSTPYTRNGRIDGTPTGNGLDTEPGLAYARSAERNADLSFLSVVYPKGRWAVAIYRHHLVNFEFEAGTQGLFGERGSCCGQRFADQTTRSLFDFVGYGLSGAWRLHESLSLGVGLTLFEGSLVGESDIYRPDDPWEVNRYRPSNLISGYEVNGNASSHGVSAGILWSPTESLHLGAFYRQGPEIPVTVGLTYAGGDRFAFDADLELPAVFGVGAAVRTRDGRFAASVEWDRVEYSRIVESVGFTEIDLDDGDEAHVGVEYLFIDSALLWSIRGGVWLDPDHRTRYVEEDDPFESALHPPGDDELHFALGFGIVFRPFQLDVAVAVSDPVDTISLSAIYSF